MISPVVAFLRSFHDWHASRPPLCNFLSVEQSNPSQAPDVFNLEGTYYLYYSVSTSGSQVSDIGVATSTTMDPGSWVDHGSIGLPPQTPEMNYNRIDANLLQPENSRGTDLVLAFGSFWSDIYQLRMQDPPLAVAGPDDNDINHLTFNGTRRTPPITTTGAQEGAYQFWWPVHGTTYYYLFFSAGNCCNLKDDLAPPGEEYRVMVCRSESYSGGFVDKDGRDCLQGGGTLVLGSHGDVYAPGGQGVIFDKDLNAVILYYHYGKHVLSPHLPFQTRSGPDETWTR